MNKPVAIVTDHAVIRYLERVQGIDVDAIRRLIGQKIDCHLAEHDALSGVVLGKHVYKLRGCYVTTVVLRNQPKQSRSLK